MKRLSIVIALVSVSAVCGWTHAQPLLSPDVGASAPPPSSDTPSSAPKDELQQPAEIGNIAGTPSGQGEQLPPGKGGTLSLEELEQMAMANNPAVAQAAARVSALRGRFVQVGLPPNPEIGYLASEIGNERKAGQQGGFVGQEFVTGGKLGLNRAVVSQEIQLAEQVRQAMELRVLTDVRLAYYAALVATRRKELANELLQIGDKSAEASVRLNTSGEIARTDALPIIIEKGNAQIVLKNAIAEYESAWRRLSSVVGADLPPSDLAGDISKLPALFAFDDQLVRLVSSSPEMAAAFAEIGRSQNALARARREPVPNLLTQFIVQQDNATNDTIAGVQVGIPLPIWNRNQGGILQAEAEVFQARRNVERVELNLKRRLAFAFQRYSSAQERAKIYFTVPPPEPGKEAPKPVGILPDAEENFELVQGAFPGQVSSLEFYTAQRIFFQTKLAYLDALAELWASRVEIEGLLLSDSLNTPPQ